MCKLCKKKEIETWEHVKNCKRTKEILKAIQEIAKDTDKKVMKEWSIWKIRCKEDYGDEKQEKEQIQRIYKTIQEEEQIIIETWKKIEEEK